MALTLPMDDAVPGEIASSADYNILIDNILDLDTRVNALTPGTRYNIERRLNATTTIGASANTKVPFDTSINAGAGITYTGGTTRSFTFANAGVYTLSASLRIDAADELYLWFAPTSDASQDRGKTSLPSGSLNLATSATFRIAAAGVFSVWTWCATGVDLLREGGTGLAPWVSIEFVGPQ
jgi:hypothetical protein